jgi:hypothetical protein
MRRHVRPFRILRSCLIAFVASVLIGTSIHAGLPDPLTSEPNPSPAACASPAIEYAPVVASYPVLDWTKVPPIRATPRAGNFLVPPTDPGAYSLSEELHHIYHEKAPSLPYSVFGFVPTPGFDIDFRYLDKPDNQQWDYLDPLKRIHCGDDWLISFGGQTWVRYMNEVNSRLTTINNDYTLLRARPFIDVWYRDAFRVYAEFIYAESFDAELNPLAIDINRGDVLNLFADLKVWESCDGKESAHVRVGRQELLYGSQRLISTLDWGNTRRTFQGIKGFYIGEEWDLDAFWVQPIRVDRNEFDSVDNNQNLFGLWATRKIRKGTAWDIYYLDLDNTNPVAVGNGGVRGAQNVHTIGSRYYGDKDNWMWDVEGMMQLGTYSNQDKLAFSSATGLGYHFKDVLYHPQVWVYYDWASGDRDPGVGDTNETFNQLFPFGHYYYGFLDLVARQNIHDVYGQVALYPRNWVTLFGQFHQFWLDNDKDALYSPGGVPLRRDPTGNAGNDVGSEIDLVLSMQVCNHTNVLVGWSKLFSGSFIERTGPDVAPELFYVQCSFRW